MFWWAIPTVTVLISSPATAQQPSRQHDEFESAKALHDSGHYKEAIERYKALLQKRPEDPLLLYELAYSYMATKDYSHCIEYSQRAGATRGKIQAAALGALATCQDDSGARAEALATFAKALKSFPKDPTLNYNYAVTLANTADFEGARARLRTAIEQAPDRASSYFAYARVLEADKALGAAVYMYLRFVMLDSRPERATEACKRVAQLLYVQLDAGKRQVEVDRPNAVAAETSKLLTTLNLALATSAATAGSHQGATSAADKAGDALTSFLQIGLELRGGDKASHSFTLDHTVPQLHSLVDAKLLRVFLLHVALLAELDGAAAGIAANKATWEKMIRTLSTASKQSDHL
jgi:tetratricopeptide (TPR) repeat protein